MQALLYFLKREREEQKTMICQNCGTQLPDGTPSCPTCGTQFFAQPQQPYMDPNQPYTSAPVMPAKKNNTGMIIGIIAAVIAVVAVIIVLVKVLGGEGGGSAKSPYDGTYKFTKGYAYGIEVTLEQMEQINGQSYDMTLIVKGNKCTMEAPAMGIDKAVCKIKIDGTDVELIDGDTTMTGTYDEVEKSISIYEPTSGSTLVFELVD